MFCLKWNKSENKLNSCIIVLKMLCATRAIGRKVLEHSGISSEYTHRNFSTILRSVSWVPAILKTNENRMSDYNNVTKSYSLFINASIGHNNEFPIYFRPVGRRSHFHMEIFWIQFYVKVHTISHYYRLQRPQFLFTSEMECSTEISE